MAKKEEKTMDKIVSLCKRRGFIYPTSEIYGGLANSYDYGPMGAELLRNIRNLWWREFVNKRQDMVGIDSQIMLHPKTWLASGHVGSFNDPMVEDKKTHKRYRADHLIEEFIEGKEEFKDLVVEDLDIKEMTDFIKKYELKSPDGNEITQPKAFNLLFETAIGSVSGEKAKVYLRGETAQGIFTNFKQVLDSNRVKLPFGVGQIGKSFRNEITTGQFVFRTLEFEQAEIEYFFNPDETDWKKLFKSWQDSMWKFITEILGVKEKNLRWRRHTDKERSHYSKDTYDLDYNYPFGWKELWGIAYRTDYDLKQHVEYSKENLTYTDPKTNKKFVPHVIEPAVGVNRMFLMTLVDGFFEDKENDRIVLKLDKKLAPYKLAVFPLLKNKPELVEKAKEVYDELKESYVCDFDSNGNVGKRYRRQDEIGTPYCVTIDFDSLEDGKVTVRDRDTMEQKRVEIGKLEAYFLEEFEK
ncbi:MAG: glycine--tRNA ligase [Candidatus Moranbacteria bacterium]|nr:glycine--tRNA ligase [Candidatus Moranbacteria bacterium]